MQFPLPPLLVLIRMSKIKILFITIVLACIPVHAQNQELIQNLSVRNTISLDGTWNYIVDPYGHGGYMRPSGFARDRAFDGTILQDYDFGSSPTLQVPGDWNTQSDKLYYYEGILWYRRHFQYNLESGNRLFIRFEASNYETVVFLNGKLLGVHEGGYTPFEYEITDNVISGDNSLVVRVDNKRREDGVPTLNTDWWNYGGITRSVYLVQTPSTFIRDYGIHVNPDNDRLVEGYVQLDGGETDQTVNISIPELKINAKVQTNSNGYGSFSINSKPVLWDVDNPKLYDVILTSKDDKVKDQIGFRTIKTDGTKILLNGKEVFLAGINAHEETAFNNSRANNAAQDATLLQWAKDLGCNFVRLAHYPHNEDMVRTAEKMGLLIWSEIPLYWGIDWKNEKTYQLAEQQLEEMISRDHNRCNIIIWSIANETAINPDRTAFLTRLAEKARSIDNTRLIAAAMQNREIEPLHMTLTDPLCDVLDILSFNEYIGWYDGPKDKCDKVKWTFPVDKPVVISEFGGGAKYGNFGSSEHYFTEDYLDELYKHQFQMLDRIPALAGTIPWVLKDFRSPHRLIPGIQDDFNRKGLYSDQGQKKKAFYTVRAWNLRKTGKAE